MVGGAGTELRFLVAVGVIGSQTIRGQRLSEARRA